MRFRFLRHLGFAAVFLISVQAQAQFSTRGMQIVPGVQYEIGGITLGGGDNLDPNVVILLSGLKVGDKITLPGEKVTKAIKALWKQNLFEDIQISVTQVQGDKVFLEIHLRELPKLSKFYFTGIKKGQKDNLRESLKLSRGKVVTENLIISSRNKIRNYYLDKGYLNVDVNVVQEPDTSFTNAVILGFRINTGPKVKIGEINFDGNQSLNDRKLRRSMKKTKKHVPINVFRSSKFLRDEYREDKSKLIRKYNESGYRDARILKDSIYKISDNRVGVYIKLEEGNKYYFRDINFLGNAKYPTDLLERILNIKKGDVYDAGYLNERVQFDPKGNDIASLYLDNGYLFSSIVPVEVRVDNDSIDIEIRIREGRQATVNKVIVDGNDRTNDRVIYREMRTRPGDLFSRSDIQRTIRELSQLGFFDPQNIGVNPKPDPETGTVDIEYTVTERSTSQLELQGGWGGGFIVGTLGLNFNNFSAQNIFNKKAWKPLPTGDGQTLALRAQTNGSFFQSYSFSFTEPWLGGRKPQSLTFSLYHNIMSDFSRGTQNAGKLYTTGMTIGLGKRLKWPDDYFTLYQAVEIKEYKLRDFESFIGGGFLNFSNGVTTNINYKISLSRNSTDVPIFPTRGSNISVALELTPPYSLFSDEDYSMLEDRAKFRFMEYYKWRIRGDWFSELFKNLVFRSSLDIGILNFFNSDIGVPPFERYFLGGDGLQNFALDGREFIALRGYPNQSVTPPGGAAVFNRYIFELRYLISPNPQAQIFVLSFLEGGNSFRNLTEFNPFEMKRSAGFGVRIFMPMFGLLGVDFGHGFDDDFRNPGVRSGWRTHFIIGQQF